MANSEPIRLVAGLGNPGREYARTRHNAGYWWVERLAQARGVAFAREARFAGEVARLPGGTWLVKPTTYMNRSGQAVRALASFYRIPAGSILVVHDELDLKPGEAKIKLGGGVAGHNGLKDIVLQLGTQDFWRMRIGIGHPREAQAGPREVIDWVLLPPRAEELTAIEEAIEKSLAVWPHLEAGEPERAMHALHTKPKAPNDAASGGRSLPDDAATTARRPRNAQAAPPTKPRSE